MAEQKLRHLPMRGWVHPCGRCSAAAERMQLDLSRGRSTVYDGLLEASREDVANERIFGCLLPVFCSCSKRRVQIVTSAAHVVSASKVEPRHRFLVHPTELSVESGGAAVESKTVGELAGT